MEKLLKKTPPPTTADCNCQGNKSLTQCKCVECKCTTGCCPTADNSSNFTASCCATKSTSVLAKRTFSARETSTCIDCPPGCDGLVCEPQTAKVMQLAPKFEAMAYCSNNTFRKVSLNEYKGKCLTITTFSRQVRRVVLLPDGLHIRLSD